MFKAALSKVSSLSTTAKVVLGLVLFGAVGAAAMPNNTIPSSVNKSQQQGAGSQVKAMVIKQIIETEDVDFSKKTEDNPSLPQGQTQLKTIGIKGIKAFTYEVSYAENVEVSRKLIKEEITKTPVDEVTYIGTYVAPVVQSPAPTKSSCDPNYAGVCVPITSDVDCAGGSGNGPAYVRGPVYVVGSDIYDLDRDGDGVGCE